MLPPSVVLAQRVFRHGPSLRVAAAPLTNLATAGGGPRPQKFGRRGDPVPARLMSSTARSPPLVGQAAPQFSANASMPDGSFKKVALADYEGQYVALLFYPLDFTFVCPSEIIAFDQMEKEFKKRNVQLLGCSIDSHHCHNAWRNTPRNKGGLGEISFPLLSDITKVIANDFGVLHENGLALRGFFLLNKDHKICHAVVNDFPLGRSVQEALRMVDALQHFEQFGEVCPANWAKGKEAMKPTAEGVARYITKM